MTKIETVDLKISVPKAIVDYVTAMLNYYRYDETVEQYLAKQVIHAISGDFCAIDHDVAKQLIELYGLKKVFALLDC